MHLLGYRRVSTLGQEEDGISLETQEYLLLKAGVKPADLYGDVQTGMLDSRPEFEKLIERAIALRSAGHEVRIIVTQADRLTRSLQKRVEIVELFDRLGIELQALNKGLITSKTVAEWASSTFDAVFSEYTIRTIRENVLRTKSYAREMGHFLGGTAPYGYRLNQDKTLLEPNLSLWMDTGLTVWQIARLTVDHFLRTRMSVRMLSEYTNRTWGKKWEATGLRDWLVNKALVGHLECTIGGWTKADVLAPKRKKRRQVYAYNRHPALITEAEHLSILSILDENQKRWGNRARSVGVICKPLQGQMKCFYCNRNLCSGVSDGFLYFRCPEINCPAKGTVRGDRVELVVQKALTERAEAIAILAAAPQEPIEDPEVLRLKEQLQQLLELKQQSGLVSLDLSIQEVQNQIINYQQPLHQINSNRLEMEQIISAIRNPEFWIRLTEEERRLTYKDLVESIVVRDKEIIRIVLKV